MFTCISDHLQGWHSVSPRNIFTVALSTVHYNRIRMHVNARCECGLCGLPLGSLVLFHLQKMQIGGSAILNCPKLWMSVWMGVWCSAMHWHPLTVQHRLRIHHNPGQDEGVSEDQWMNDQLLTVVHIHLSINQSMLIVLVKALMYRFLGQKESEDILISF